MKSYSIISWEISLRPCRQKNKRRERLRKRRTHYTSDWNEWKEFCEKHNEDPYETTDIGFDLGGGDSEDYIYTGDIPEREEV